MRARNRKTSKLVLALALVTSAGCAVVREASSPGVVQHRFVQSPHAAGLCFARNAERRSSALVAVVSQPDAWGRVTVIVRVQNGVNYATLDLRPVGARADGTITLMVISKRGTEELVDFLVEGC